MHFYALIFLEKINIQYFSSKKINWKKNSKNMLGALKILILSSKLWFCETFFWFCAWSKLIKNCLFSLDFSLFLLYFAKIARFYWNLPISPLFEAQNRGNSAIGDTSPAHNFHRQREAQNRGFGEKSPEMATLMWSRLCLQSIRVKSTIFGHFWIVKQLSFVLKCYLFR